jgi:RimJ/RimL family protein N-acetyltransferase
MYAWMCDPQVSVNFGLRRQPSLSATAAWIERACDDPSISAFAVIANGAHVGNVVLDRIDTYVKNARLSLYVGQAECRGRGVGRTAIYLGTQAGIEKHGLHKVWASIHADNWASLNAFSRVGYVLEGVLRDERLHDGRWLPMLYMGIVESDFRQLKVGTE